ncbi:NAD-dependent epimerase/dehydratase family protein [Micrococcus sp. EYE_162]|uniref:polysaccharide biosynthesis C-terminal domain-containing protein n=1 Tax=unclassified Micrococcus TaxID=2620948 RepID=UPI00200610AA|nr:MULTISPECIES: NAD-dependent epimerase/dehydratase family protein [unclassified Micrococcus]MCK6095138.1 NAD-dependent epimerase/dehydratase family protein [Micrococcus sp. EYE_212]MCK6171085.1 NAD-dependent epimerase/dehydratase family protein [Micrococcus sp. EYE_162]
MARYVLTGGRGFLGLHTRAALQEHGHEVALLPVGDSFDPEAARAALDGADQLLHLAGVNRGTDQEVAEGNNRFARQVAEVLGQVDSVPSRVVFANSTQAANGSVYGEAKTGAADVLGTQARNRGAEYEDIRLPNLFGEFGRPFYNAVTATFCHLIAAGETPEVQQDKELTLLHAQHAADVLVGAVPVAAMDTLAVHKTVSGLAARLGDMARTYKRTEFPDLATDFDRDLFNTYRSYLYPHGLPLPITRHGDVRGSFFEIVRSRGGTGQTSFSTTAPGVTRGDHYHRRKVERFTVLAGEAEISLRKMGTDEVHVFRVNGEQPVSVDMPTLVSHKITNVGASTLYTAFWTNDIFDPTNPDTIPEVV